MAEQKSINLVFVTAQGKKKTISMNGCKAYQEITSKNVENLSNFIIGKNVIEMTNGDKLTGLHNAYVEEKTVTPINL